MQNNDRKLLNASPSYSATYDVQDVELRGGRENISIQCVFASGSQARGCLVVIRNSSTDKITSFFINVTRNSSSQAEQTLTGLTPGSYEVLIFDWERDGSVASTPSYVGHVNVTEPAVFTTSTLPTKITGRRIQQEPSRWTIEIVTTATILWCYLSVILSIVP